MHLKLKVSSQKKKQVIDITDHLQTFLTQNNFQTGICSIFVLHTTASITTADLDPGTDLDLLEALEAIAPTLNYRHPHDPEHAPDHIMSSMIGPSVNIPVENTQLLLGTWQRIVLIELDGPRNRELIITLR